MNRLPERLKRRLGIALIAWAIILALSFHFVSFRGIDGFKAFSAFAFVLALIMFFIACCDEELMSGFFSQSAHSKYWIIYHATLSLEIARQIIVEGFRPGPRNKLGEAFYGTIHFHEAQTYCGFGGVIFRLYIQTTAPWTEYSAIPGRTTEEKRMHAMQNNQRLAFVRDRGWFIVFGHRGIPLTIPGLIKAEMLDYWGNPISI